MDPFVATIVKQGAVLALGAAAAVFLFYVAVKMASLQKAMLNNIYPAGLTD